MRKEFKVGVFGIIRNNENEILLCLRNDYDLWNLPGGGLEKGESPWQGVIREIKEETGLNAEIIRLTGVYSKPEKDEIVFSFECKIIDGELKLNDEAKDIKYFSLDRIPENMVQKQLERIRDLFSDENRTFLKIQTGKSTIDLINEKKIMLNIQEYVDIKNYSTFKIGGQFRYFIVVKSKEELLSIFSIFQLNEKYKDLPVFILGGGSNVIFSDGVINVIAIKIEIKGFEIINQKDEYTDIKVGSGENWDDLVSKTVDMDLQGLEALSSIPGTVGATPVQNVGAYGVEVKDTILEVEVFDLNQKMIKTISNSDCRFGYRDSIFKNKAKGMYVITAVIYRLKNMGQQYLRSNSLALEYPGVKDYFGKNQIINPNLKQIREAIIEIRKEKLPNPKETPNVGSFFKNPIVENSIVEKIKVNFPDLKFFPIDEKLTKIPAGWLIEKAGLKGKSFGHISVYDKNALVLTSDGQTSKKDLEMATKEIIKIVNEKFGIALEQEPEVV